MPAGGMALWIKFNLPYQTHYTEALSHLNIDSEYNFGSHLTSKLDGFYIRYGFAALSEVEMTQIIQSLSQVLLDG